MATDDSEDLCEMLRKAHCEQILSHFPDHPGVVRERAKDGLT